jgi:hypothetical protein
MSSQVRVPASFRGVSGLDSDQFLNSDPVDNSDHPPPLTSEPSPTPGAEENPPPVGIPTPTPLEKPPRKTTKGRKLEKKSYRTRNPPPAILPDRKNPRDVRALALAEGLNPNTHIRHLARPYAPEALGVLVEVMRDEKNPVSARIIAANGVLDRAYGKPKEYLEVDSGNEARTVLAGVSSADLRELLSLARAAQNAIDVTPVREPKPALPVGKGEKEEPRDP